MAKPHKIQVVYWEAKGPTSPSIWVESIDHFDARGKRRVYGRGDHFGRLTLNMDVWRNKDGRLFVRFWSRNDEVDWYSYEIMGFSGTKSTDDPTPLEFCEHWVPECLRKEYDAWVTSEMTVPIDWRKILR